jgi:hypothetical protein
MLYLPSPIGFRPLVKNDPVVGTILLDKNSTAVLITFNYPTLNQEFIRLSGAWISVD